MAARSDELIAALTELLGSSVIRLTRTPCPYQSSFPLEELEVSLADRTDLQLMFKDLGSESILDHASRLKPGFLYNPHREIRTYANILSSLEPGTAVFHGAVVDEAIGRYWL